MSKLITQIKRLALAVCLATPVVSWATPTATAVWRNNLDQSYTIGGVTYELGAGDGTLNGNGTVTAPTGFNWAPSFDISAAAVDKVSVLVKYSGLTLAETRSASIAFAAIKDNQGNEVSAIVKPDATKLSATHYQYNAGGPTHTVLDGDGAVCTGSGYLLFSYSASNGSRAYMGATIAELAGGENTQGHWSNKTIAKLSIGGDARGEFADSCGFTIEEVAIFVGSYFTASDVADYVFPTVTVDTTATMTMTELNTAVAAFGENTFNYFSASPVVTLDVAPSDATKAYLRSALWNGTVFIKDQNIVNLDPTAYGNKNSTLKLSGVSGHWGVAVYANTATPAIELEDSETEDREYGFFASNGYSFYSSGNYYYVHTPELKGSGTYKANTTGNGALFVADKFDNFTGKLDLDGKTVWLGTGAPTHTLDTWNNLVNFPGTVRLGSTIPANYSNWNVPNGYKGTVVKTTAANATEAGFLTNSKWKGTCQLNWNPGNSPLDIVNYGNANSVVEIVTAFGPYPTQNGGEDGAEFDGEIKLSADWTINNGWTAESYRTTFAKLSGTGTLTVNGGNGGVGAPVPYTITRLEGFTGTIAGARGKFTIGTIVASTEPTPGTKLVNCTTTNAPVLDSTTVVYTNAEQDVKLEFKAGDGIYVAEPTYVARVDGTDYETVADAAAVAWSVGKVITLLADAEFTFASEDVGKRPLKIALNDFTCNFTLPGETYALQTVEGAEYNQYSVIVVAARVGDAVYGTVYAALSDVVQKEMPVGTVVTVVDSTYNPNSDTDVAFLMYYFRWKPIAKTFTRIATVEGVGETTVEAATKTEAENAVTIIPTDKDVVAALNGRNYSEFFTKTAEETSEGSGVWTVTAELNKAVVFGAAISPYTADTSVEVTDTVVLDGVLDDTEDTVVIPARPGLYYSFKSGDDVTAMKEGGRKLANGESVELDKVDGDTFYQVLVNTADK